MTFESQSREQAGLDQLEKVALEFESWRRNKKSHTEKIPQSLLREAQKLTQHLGSRAVRQRLGITKSQLDKLEGPKPKSDESIAQADFMQVVPVDAKTPPATLTVNICTPQGITISLSGLAYNDPLPLIAQLIEGELC